MPDQPEVPPDLIAQIDALADAIAERPGHADVARQLEWLVDALIMRGQLPAVYRQRIAKIRGERAQVMLASFRDKYNVPSTEIDCEARLHLCHARCCSFVVTLSAQDITEGKLPFDVAEPYTMPKHPDTKRCVCMNAEGTCTVYDHRPGTCRAYSCTQDPRVWIDFEARIPAPMQAAIRPKGYEGL